MRGKQGRSASQGEACLQVEKKRYGRVAMPVLQFGELEKIGSRPGFLKKMIQFGRILSKEEGSDGNSRVIWEIPVKVHSTLERSKTEEKHEYIR